MMHVVPEWHIKIYEQKSLRFEMTINADSFYEMMATLQKIKLPFHMLATQIVIDVKR
jgi:hypothetical protein